MVVKASYKLEGADFLKDWARDKHGPAFEAALRKGGELWIAEFLPRHFTFEAYRLYGYKPRARSTAERSRRINGRALPLVRTGQLRRMALSGAAVEAVKGMLRLSVPLPFYANFKPQIRSEVVRMHPSELQRMAEVIIAAYAEALEAEGLETEQ